MKNLNQINDGGFAVSCKSEALCSGKPLPGGVGEATIFLGDQGGRWAAGANVKTSMTARTKHAREVSV